MFYLHRCQNHTIIRTDRKYLILTFHRFLLSGFGIWFGNVPSGSRNCEPHALAPNTSRTFRIETTQRRYQHLQYEDLRVGFSSLPYLTNQPGLGDCCIVQKYFFTSIVETDSCIPASRLLKQWCHEYHLILIRFTRRISTIIVER